MSAPYKTRVGAVVSTGAAASGAIPLGDAAGKLDISWLPGAPQSGSGIASTVVNRFEKTDTVVYPVPYAFGSVPRVFIQPRGNAKTAGNIVTGYYPDHSILTEDHLGFTVIFNTNHGETSTEADFVADVPYHWFVLGELP